VKLRLGRNALFIPAVLLISVNSGHCFVRNTPGSRFWLSWAVNGRDRRGPLRFMRSTSFGSAEDFMHGRPFGFLRPFALGDARARSFSSGASPPLRAAIALAIRLVRRMCDCASAPPARRIVTSPTNAKFLGPTCPVHRIRSPSTTIARRCSMPKGLVARHPRRIPCTQCSHWSAPTRVLHADEVPLDPGVRYPVVLDAGAGAFRRFVRAPSMCTS